MQQVWPHEILPLKQSAEDTAFSSSWWKVHQRKTRWSRNKESCQSVNLSATRMQRMQVKQQKRRTLRVTRKDDAYVCVLVTRDVWHNSMHRVNTWKGQHTKKITTSRQIHSDVSYLDDPDISGTIWSGYHAKKMTIPCKVKVNISSKQNNITADVQRDGHIPKNRKWCLGACNLQKSPYIHVHI